MKLPRFRTGDPRLDAEIAALVDQVEGTPHEDLIFELIASALLLARDRVDRGDLKIANAALQELRHAFATFAPYRASRKVGIFGSARTRSDDPLYEQTVRLAEAMAAHDWMVITGAGPGIMEAGIEGAGSDHAFGVAIRLPFESPTSQFVADDPKLMQLPLLLHPQGHLPQGVARVRAPARWLRDDGRGVRAADAGADGQGAAGARSCSSTSRAARTGRRGTTSSSARCSTAGTCRRTICASSG